MNYRQIKDIEPILFECFFAFSKSQMEEGIKEHKLEGIKLYSGIGGLYGTKEGIKQLYDFYDNQTKQIAEECNPQDVYNYEFDNRECSYTNDDKEAFDIVISIFGEERAVNDTRRRFAYQY